MIGAVSRMAPVAPTNQEALRASWAISSSLRQETIQPNPAAHTRLANFASAKLWELFDGDRERLNIAHECIDRHVDGEKTAVIVVKAAGGEEILSYRRISEDSARFAHWLIDKGVVPGDRVAIKLEPSRAFYAAVFGAVVVFFEAFTGQLPIASAWLAALVLAAARDESRPGPFDARLVCLAVLVALRMVV